MQMIKTYDTLTVYTDGGARGNPGPAGVGAVFYDTEGNNAWEVSRYIGIATNNVAEYLAVVYALQEALFLKTKNIIIKTDSQLVERQLTGEYKVKDQNLLKFYDLSMNLLKRFDNITIEHVPRKENSEADALVNVAIDNKILI